jgi:hypothetical protein
MRGMQYNVEFVYQLSICSRTEEKLMQIVFENSVLTPRRTQHFNITEIILLLRLLRK